LVGDALGVGETGACWRGGTGWRRQGCWWERQQEGEVGALAGGGVVRDVAGSGAHRQGRRGRRR
jgi:hypothetical protein